MQKEETKAWPADPETSEWWYCLSPGCFQFVPSIADGWVRSVDYCAACTHAQAVQAKKKGIRTASPRGFALRHWSGLDTAGPKKKSQGHSQNTKNVLIKYPCFRRKSY